MIPTIFGVTLMVFIIIHLIPGDAVTLMMAESANVDKEQVEVLKKNLGLDKPLYIQYLVWLRNLARGDLGHSLWTKQPVIKEIGQKLPVTFELTLFSMIFSLLFAIPVGIISAVKQDTASDYVSRLFSIGGLSVPNFWLATLFIVLPSIWFLWTPPVKYYPFFENPRLNLIQMIFPTISMGLALSATVMRMMRSALLEVFRQDYIRTARAKGLRETLVVGRHALKNSLNPVISIIGVQFGTLLGGTIIIEQVFSLPGIGSLMLDSIFQRDYPLLQGLVLFLALVYVMVNFITDLMYAWLDPRIHYR